MEKIKFMFDNGEQSVEFFVLEETKINGVSYILVTDSEDEDGECMILKDTSAPEEKETVYQVVDDDVELGAVSKVFGELLEDIEIEM